MPLIINLQEECLACIFSERGKIERRGRAQSGGKEAKGG